MFCLLTVLLGGLPMPDLAQLSAHSGIPQPVLAQIIAAARKHAQRVVLYGSRARGNHHPESDIDIAFFGSNEGFFRFETCMEQLPTLLEYDLVHVTEKTSPAFAGNIKKDGIVLMDASTVKIEQLRNALSRLEEAIAEYRQTGSTAVRDGAIQRFEFCAELAWKAAQDYMQAQGYLDVHSPKAVMRKAYAEHLITDEAGWLALLDARNQTSHLYDDAVADAVYQAIGNTYLPLLRELSEKLSAAI